MKTDVRINGRGEIVMPFHVFKTLKANTICKPANKRKA